MFDFSNFTNTGSISFCELNVFSSCSLAAPKCGVLGGKDGEIVTVRSKRTLLSVVCDKPFGTFLTSQND